MRGSLLLAAALALPCRAAPAAASPSDEAGGQLFASVTTQRRERFLHEVFEFTVSVYSRGLTMGREIALLNEETPGLQFRPFRDEGGGSEEVNGRVYEVRRFLGRAEAVATGVVVLRPTVHVSVVVPGGGRSRSQAGIRQAELHPVPLSVAVLALPAAGKPAGFSGAVGSFGFTAAVRPSAPAVGEPVTLTMEVRGSGNVGSVASPQAPAGDRFKTFEPRLLRKEVGEDGYGGRLVFEQVLVPRTAASTPLPAVSFSYFDPERRAYREIVRGPFPLALRAAGPQDATAAPASAAAPAAAPAVARSRVPAAIAPLKPEPRSWLALPARSWRPSFWFLALQCVPLALAAALLFALRHRDELARDVGKARRLAAPEVALSGFDAARRALREGSAARFHDALWEALSSYLANRLNLRPGEISIETAAAGLGGAGAAPPVVARLSEILGLLERERFGRPPGAAALSPAGQQRLATLVEEVERLVRALEEGGA